MGPALPILGEVSALPPAILSKQVHKQVHTQTKLAIFEQQYINHGKKLMKLNLNFLSSSMPVYFLGTTVD